MKNNAENFVAILLGSISKVGEEFSKNLEL